MAKPKTHFLELELTHRNIQRLAKLALEYNSTMSQVINAMIETFYNYNENLKKSEKKRKYHKNH